MASFMWEARIFPGAGVLYRSHRVKLAIAAAFCTAHHFPTPECPRPQATFITISKRGLSGKTRGRDRNIINVAGHRSQGHPCANIKITPSKSGIWLTLVLFATLTTPLQHPPHETIALVSGNLAPSSVTQSNGLNTFLPKLGHFEIKSAVLRGFPAFKGGICICSLGLYTEIMGQIK